MLRLSALEIHHGSLGLWAARYNRMDFFNPVHPDSRSCAVGIMPWSLRPSKIEWVRSERAQHPVGRRSSCLGFAVGRLRPDFLSRCRWNETVHACTG